MPAGSNAVAARRKPGAPKQRFVAWGRRREKPILEVIPRAVRFDGFRQLDFGSQCVVEIESNLDSVNEIEQRVERQKMLMENRKN
jgi:hypothetical protein